MIIKDRTAPDFDGLKIEITVSNVEMARANFRVPFPLPEDEVQLLAALLLIGYYNSYHVSYQEKAL